MVSVLFAGGGTAGHVSPMLAIAKEVQAQDPTAQITMLGTSEGLETRLVPQAGFELVTIAKVPAPRRLTAQTLLFPVKLTATVARVRQLLKEREVDVVVGVGGYVSSPAYLAAKSLGIPIVIHEANAVVGMANKLGAKLTDAKFIGYTFASTPLAGEQVGMPMRAEITALHDQRHAFQAQARAHLGLAPELPTVVVTGGSSGAQKINEAFAQALRDTGLENIQVLHITGANKGEELRELASAHPNYHVVDYVDGMEHAYAAADLLVCRSGAGTVAEATVAGVPALYVPLAIGNGEQARNAADVVAVGAALLVANADFNAQTVTETIAGLVTNPNHLATMETALRELSFPIAAAHSMTAKIFQAARKPRPSQSHAH